MLGPFIPLLAGCITALALIVWFAVSGWRIQDLYLVSNDRKSLLQQTCICVNAVGAGIGLFLAHNWLFAPAYVGLAIVGPLSAYVDWRVHLLPNRYTLVLASCLVFGAVSTLILSNERITWEPSYHALIGAAIWTIPLLAASMIRYGLGLGDLKLAPVLGGISGLIDWQCSLFALVLSFLAAGIYACVKIIGRYTELKSRIPMGPWLISGTLIAVPLWDLSAC